MNIYNNSGFIIKLLSLYMTSLLLRQFAEGRYKNLYSEMNKVLGFRKPQVLDRVIPNLTQNLCNASESFIDAVINKDLDFIQSTATLALKRKLAAQFKSMGNNVHIKKVDNKKYHEMLDQKGSKMQQVKQSKGQFSIISPYVIFRQKIGQRNLSEKPWEFIAPFLAMNRYVYYNPGEPWSWAAFKDNQIFGFNCHITDYKYQFQVSENNQKKIYPPREFVLTFQTDSQNHDFTVADFNYFVKEDLSVESK